MGTRHLYGLRELIRTPFCNVELAEAILREGLLEVDGVEGMKDVAGVYAIFESSRTGRAVQMSEVESGRVYDYQAEIDATLGIE